MAEQCIVCLDPLLHAEEPPPPPGDDKTPLSNANPDNATTIRPTADGASKQEPGVDPVDPAPPAAAATTATAATTSTAATASANNNNESPSDKENVAVIQVCGHTLHNECLKEWSGKANSCPICRQTFHSVHVFDKIGGTLLSTYKVEDKKQVADYDARTLLEEIPVLEDEDISTPCPVCNLADDEDVLLLCDGCDTPYHTHCIGLDGVPEGAWFCMECVSLFGDSVQTPAAQNHPFVTAARLNGRNRPWNDFFPRTRQSMRRARQRARSDEWQGAWGQITGRIWEALNLDVDHDEDDTLEEYRRLESQRNNERREFERWQERLDIARRLGAQEVFEQNIPILQHARPSAAPQQPRQVTPRETREERIAWGSFERARDCDSSTSGSRKRKPRSITASPVEPAQEPERKPKRPRTRRITAVPGESSANGAVAVTAAAAAAAAAGPSRGTANGTTNASPGGSSSAPAAARSPNQAAEEPRSFLSSLLKEVEMSTPSDDENVRSLFGDNRPTVAMDPSSPVGSSPAVSAHNSPRAMSATPPPQRVLRPSSPTLLSSHIEPIYPPANYSPNRSGASPSSDHSDTDSNNNNNTAHTAHAVHTVHAPTVAEIRQPRPRRRPIVALPRSQDVSPSRSPPLTLEMKESISNIVRTALKPHWKASQLTADQYAAINRDVSHKLYEEVTNPAAADAEVRKIWEKRATKEVERAVADLQA